MSGRSRANKGRTRRLGARTSARRLFTGGLPARHHPGVASAVSTQRRAPPCPFTKARLCQVLFGGGQTLAFDLLAALSVLAEVAARSPKGLGLGRRPAARTPGGLFPLGARALSNGRAHVALGPSHRRDQGRADPAQTAGLLKAAPARTDGVPVHGTAAELRSPATFDRGIQADEHRASRDERLDEQAQQGPCGVACRPACPV